MKLLISRWSDTGKQSIGNGIVLNDKNEPIYDFYTLELSWKNNKQSESCIPPGDYTVIKRKSKKFKTHFHILDVKGREWILIHKGNYYTDIRGCVLVGDDLQYINNDEEIDVCNSKDVMKKLYKLLHKRFDLSIINV